MTKFPDAITKVPSAVNVAQRPEPRTMARVSSKNDGPEIVNVPEAPVSSRANVTDS